MLITLQNIKIETFIFPIYLKQKGGNKKMDTAIVVLLIVLLIVFGIFFISTTSSGGQPTGYNTYQNPGYVGGGCGR